MSSIALEYIDEAYVSLLHSGGVALPATGLQDIYDGAGNKSSLALGQNCNGAKVCGDLQVDSLTIGTTSFLDKVYPVGSLYLSVNNTNPSALFGGTWEQSAQGSFLVGVGSSTDTNGTAKSFTQSFNIGAHTIPLTVPPHRHGTGTFGEAPGSSDTWLPIYSDWNDNTAYNTRTVAQASDGGSTVGYTTTGSPYGTMTSLPVNVTNTTYSISPPSFGVYVWLRTA